MVGIGLILAPVTALVTDMQRVVRILLRMLFYATPVIYAGHLVPEPYDKVTWLNPMTGILEMMRAGFFTHDRYPIVWGAIGVVGGHVRRPARSSASHGLPPPRARRPQGDLMTTSEPVISVDGLGIEFYRSRRRRMQLREMLFHGRSGAPKETFWALRDVSFDIHARRGGRASSAATAAARARC